MGVPGIHKEGEREKEKEGTKSICCVPGALWVLLILNSCTHGGDDIHSNLPYSLNKQGSTGGREAA